MKKSILSFISLIGLISGAMAQTNVKLVADFDAAIGYDGTPYNSINAGAALQNAAYYIPGWSSGINANRALIHFNLANLPAGAKILSAKINLYCLPSASIFGGHSGSKNSSYLQRVTQNWEEYTVTWDNQPTATPINQVTLPASTSITEDYTDVDVTSLVKDMRSSSNFGFLLKLVEEQTSNFLFFASIDCGDPTKFPTLDIVYQDESTTGISSIKEDKQSFSLSPNPSNNGIINIRLSSRLTSDNNTLEVYSVIGNLVRSIKTGQETSSTLNLSDLNTGIYMVKLISGNQTYLSRLIINK